MEAENHLCTGKISKPLNTLEVYYKTYTEIANSLGLDVEERASSLLPILEDPSDEDLDSLGQKLLTIENLFDSTANNMERTSSSYNCIGAECDNEIPEERMQCSENMRRIAIDQFLSAKKERVKVLEVKERISSATRKKHGETRKPLKESKRNWITCITSSKNVKNCNCTIL